MISTLKKICISVILALSTGTSFALENLDFSLDLDFGLLNGHIYEYVFNDINQNTDHMESKLDWEVQNIPYFELAGTINAWKYLYIGINGKLGIPKSSGYMQDYDWLNSVAGMPGYKLLPSSWNNAPSNELTNYSKHDNQLLNYYTFNIAVGGNIQIPATTIKITPFLSYDYWFISFDGSKGYRKYKSENYEIIPYSKSVIAYKQEYQTFMIGTSVAGTFFEKLYVDGTLMLSPMMVYNVSIDHHKVRNVFFVDVINNAFEVKAEIQTKYLFNEFLNFGLKSSIQYIPVSKGIDYVDPQQKNGKFYLGSPEKGVQSGTSSFLWTFSLNCGLTL